MCLNLWQSGWRYAGSTIERLDFDERKSGMTKATWKTGLALLVAAVLGLGLMGMLPGMAAEAHAADKTPMKKLKVEWDLKKGKAVKSKEYFVGVGNKTDKITVKSMKTKSLKGGKKKTTFTIVYDRSFRPTKSQVHKMVRAHDKENAWFGGFYYAVTDYNTGLSLEKGSPIAMKREVEVERSEWKYTKYKKSTDSHGCWVRYPMRAQVKVTVTYPKKYKGLCLGVGANNFLAPEGSKIAKNTSKFWVGDKPFGKTYMYKKGKTNSHWMRIK